MSDPHNSADPDGHNILFIVGSPRSGTTWLQRLLATHPQIKTGQESRLFQYVGTQFRCWQTDLESASTSRGGTGLACYFSEEEFIAIQKKYLAMLLAPMVRELSSGQIFLEKTPAHALFVPEIARLLPSAKVIHLVRDPREVAASMIAASSGWGGLWAPRRGGPAIRQWWQHVCGAEQAGELLPPGQFLRVHYEDLHRETGKTLKEIAQFLRITWSASDVAEAIKNNTVEELRRGAGTPIPVRGEVAKSGAQAVKEPEGFIRRAQSGSWRQDLSWRQRFQVWRALRTIGAKWERFANKYS
jgi:hypothetical protein